MGSIKFNKQLGQHILKNPGIIDTIIDKAKIKQTDTVLEVGGGTGNLSIKLLPHCKKLVCYEKDTKLAAELIKRVNSAEYGRKFELNIGDAIKATFPRFDLCISNTPYQISSPLIFKLLEQDFRCAFLMLQKEFADRLVARPGTSEYSRLTVAVQMMAKVQHVMKVSRNSFVPPPKVDSSVVMIQPRIPRPPIDMEEFGRFLKICFLRKNKTLSGIFKGSVISQIHKVNGNFTLSEINAKVGEVLEERHLLRANKMEINDFLKLILDFKKHAILF